MSAKSTQSKGHSLKFDSFSENKYSFSENKYSISENKYSFSENKYSFSENKYSFSQSHMKKWDFYFKLCRFTVIQVKVHISNIWCNSSWNLFDKSLITSRRNFSCRLFLLSFIALATYVRKKLFRIDMVISPIWFRNPRIAHF